MNLTELLPFVLPLAKGCPEVVALFNLRLAAIELCKRTLIWTETQDEMTASSGVRAYPFAVQPGQQVIKLLSVTIDGSQLPLIPPGDGKARELNGSTSSFAYGRLGGYTINPDPATGAILVTHAALAPSMDAEEIPDELGMYADEIAGGALYRLLLSSGRDYSNPTLAMVFRDKWENDIGDIKAGASRGASTAVNRVKPAWM